MNIFYRPVILALCISLSTQAKSQKLDICLPTWKEPTSDEIYKNFEGRSLVVFRKESSRVIVNAFYFAPHGVLYGRAGKNVQGKWKSQGCNAEINCRPHLEYELEICKDCGFYESLGFTLDSFQEFSNSKVECYLGDILGLSTNDKYLNLGKDQITEVRRLLNDVRGR